MNTKRKQIYKKLNLFRWDALGLKKIMHLKQLHSEMISMECVQAVAEG